MLGSGAIINGPLNSQWLNTTKIYFSHIYNIPVWGWLRVLLYLALTLRHRLMGHCLEYWLHGGRRKASSPSAYNSLVTTCHMAPLKLNGSRNATFPCAWKVESQKLEISDLASRSAMLVCLKTQGHRRLWGEGAKTGLKDPDTQDHLQKTLWGFPYPEDLLQCPLPPPKHLFQTQ